MMGDRLATFGVRDEKLAGTVRRRLIREQQQTDRQTRHMTSEIATPIDDDDDDEDAAGIATTSAVGMLRVAAIAQPLRSHHRSVRRGTSVFVPHDIIKRPKLVALAARMKMTPAQQHAYTEALIEEAGGDVTKLTSSYATVDRSRRQVVQQIAHSCKEKWAMPRHATLHWDSKLLGNLKNANQEEERLTVVVGDADNIKLLGVPRFLPGMAQPTGETIATLTTELLNSWMCQQTIVNMAFDMTASNTGHVSAACVTLQQQLGRPLLWSGCRHHIGELVLSHVFADLNIEVSKSPDVSLFVRFRSRYDLLPFSGAQQLRPFDYALPISAAALDLLKTCQATALNVTRSQVHARDDYKEFAELRGLYLGNADDAYTFQRPGALHKARWMSNSDGYRGNFFTAIYRDIHSSTAVRTAVYRGIT